MDMDFLSMMAKQSVFILYFNSRTQIVKKSLAVSCEAPALCSCLITVHVQAHAHSRTHTHAHPHPQT